MCHGTKKDKKKITANGYPSRISSFGHVLYFFLVFCPKLLPSERHYLTLPNCISMHYGQDAFFKLICPSFALGSVQYKRRLLARTGSGCNLSPRGRILLELKATRSTPNDRATICLHYWNIFHGKALRNRLPFTWERCMIKPSCHKELQHHNVPLFQYHPTFHRLLKHGRQGRLPIVPRSCYTSLYPETCRDLYKIGGSSEQRSRVSLLWLSVSPTEWFS